MVNDNPFKGMKLSEQHTHFETTFEAMPAVKIRVTLNYIKQAGRLARGWVMLVDPLTGHLMQKNRQSTTHRFEDAIKKEIYVPYPMTGEKQADIAWDVVGKKVEELLTEYQGRIHQAEKTMRALECISFAQALDIYIENFLVDYTTSNKVRQTIRNQLKKLANHFGPKPIGEITSRNINAFVKEHKGGNAEDYVKHFEAFLRETAQQIDVPMPLEDILKKRAARRKSSKTDNEKCKRQAMKTEVLPAEYERKLDTACWENLGDPRWMAVVLIKEGGLQASQATKLRIQDIEADESDKEKVFIRLMREDLNTATRNYTFPLSPFGALYVNEFLAHLRDSYPKERLGGERYLLSADAQGLEPLEETEITSFIRQAGCTETFGYKGRVRLDDGKMFSMGVNSLHQTRQKHLKEDCRFAGDPGAISFMMHRSMGNQVQSDHYRCFTDATGRENLYQKVREDRHGCPEKQERKITRASKKCDGDCTNWKFPGREDKQGDAVSSFVIKGLKAGDVVYIRSTGCVMLSSIEK